MNQINKSKTSYRTLIFCFFLMMFCLYTLFISNNIITKNDGKNYFKKQFSLFYFDSLTDYDLIKELNKLLNETVRIFNKNNLTYWANGGTLLGALRDKGTVPWDDDADLCLWEHDLTKFLQMKHDFTKLNIEMISRIFLGTKFFKLFFKNGTKTQYQFKAPYLDIFFFKRERDFVFMKNLLNNQTIKQGYFLNDYYKCNDLFPLKTYQYEDFYINGPNSPLEYLNRAFPNWSSTGKPSVHIPNKYSPKMNQSFKIHYYNPNSTKTYLWLVNHSVSSKNENILREYLSDSFEIVTLNKKNIFSWMPELNSIKVNQRLESLLISAMFLYKYGGVFINSSLISITSKLNEIIEKLKKYEFIAFGCDSNKDCKKPSTHAMASRPKRILIENVLKKILNASNFERDFKTSIYLEEKILWNEIVYLTQKFNYEYFHYIKF